MKRSLSVSQNVRVFVTAAAIGLGAMACGSSGGNGTGGAGTGGGAGTSGGAGTGGAGTSGQTCTLDQVNTIFKPASGHTGCTTANACHDANGAAAGLDLISAGWQTHLVGRSPSATAGTLKSSCAGMNLVYLKAGSNPAAGLLIDKIDPATVDFPPCGAHMPNLGAALTADEFACVREYLTTLTKQ